MALLAIAQISNVHYVNEDTCSVEMNYVAFGEENIEQTFTAEVTQSQTGLVMSEALVAALKQRLETEHEITVGLSDTVRILGGGPVEG